MKHFSENHVRESAEKKSQLDGLDIEIIRGLADNRMNVAQTASAMFAHQNTVRYRITRVKKKTGIDPLDFYGLCKLLVLVGQMERMADNA